MRYIGDIRGSVVSDSCRDIYVKIDNASHLERGLELGIYFLMRNVEVNNGVDLFLREYFDEIYL